MVTHNGLFIHRNIHRAQSSAGSTFYTSGNATTDAEDAKQIGNSQHGAIRTGILASRPLNKKRKNKRQGQDDHTTDGHLAGPQIEQGEIRIVI